MPPASAAALPGGRAPAYAALALQTAISAGTFLAAKRALVELPPFALAMLRFAGASLLLLVVWRARDAVRLPPREAWPRVLGLAVVGVPLNQGLLMYGLQRTTPAHAALLYALTPAFVLLLAVAAGAERVRPRKLAGLALALCGAAVIIFERGAEELSAGARLGDLIVLGAVVSWAVFTAHGKSLVAAHGPLPSTVWSLVAGTLLFLPLGVPAVVTAPLASVSATGWACLLYLVVLTSVVSYLCWYYALSRLEPSRVAVFTNLQPVGTALLSWALFGHALTAPLVAGGALVLAGVAVTARRDD